MTNKLYQKKLWISILTLLIILSGCSGLPMRLKNSADQSMRYLNAEMSVAIEGSNHSHPLMKDSHQISEEKWCLTYELGPEFRFSSLWEKQGQDWVQIELRPYVDNCNWAR